MKIFQIEFSKIGTNTEVLNWITLPDIKGGKNEERYWLVRTDIQINNQNNDISMYRLLMLLHQAHINDFQTVQIMKNV